ncbi:MAG: 5'/3'-nucleotidase SurE [Chloroflexi bacterium]|nr:5'/3'-nucleotidase SurE [Chloroflexota bacterium]
MERPLILLVNDDGVESPGLAALAAALDPLGDLLIIAPRVQQSGMGRSFPGSNDGRMTETTVQYEGKSWKAYAATASPAQCVQHGVLEVADRPLALVVSGINYGENIGTGVTASGTVGAALEAAGQGVPALAISLEMPVAQHMTYDTNVNLKGAQYFSHYFAQRWLAADRPPEVDLLKIDIPFNATPETPWRMAHLERGKFYVHLAPLRNSLEDAGRIGYTVNQRLMTSEDSDAAVIRAGLVAVTPLTLDITAPITEEALRRTLNGSVKQA